MSITDELREWAEDNTLKDIVLTTYPPQHAVHGVLETLLRIADRIDAKHGQMADFCERLERAVTDREDVTLWGVDYTALPIDADGVPIHIGDRVENNERVARIVLTDGSWEPSVYIEKLPNVLHEHFCNEISHYHEPTVEDVLREFAFQIGQSATDDDIVAEYAAKLRLAEGEDE